MTAPRHECPDRMLITSGWSWTSTPITTGTHRPHPALQQDPLAGVHARLRMWSACAFCAGTGPAA